MESLPSFPTNGTPKFSWNRPEGWVAGLLLAGMGIALMSAMNKIWPIIIDFLSSGLHAVILGVAIFTIVALVWTNIGNIKDAFYLISRRIGNALIKSDPFGMAMQFLERRLQDIQNADQGLANLKGILQKLRAKRDAAKAEQEANLERSKVAHQSGTHQGEAIVAFRKATRRGKKAASLENMIQFFDLLYKRIQKYREYMQTVYDDTKDQVDDAKDQWESMKEAHGVVTSLSSFLNPNPNDREKFEAAMQFMIDDKNMKLGQIEGFFDQAQSVISSIDLDNMVIDAQALEQFADWDKKVDNILFSPEERKLLNGQSVGAFDDIFGSQESTEPIKLPVHRGGHFDDVLG